MCNVCICKLFTSSQTYLKLSKLLHELLLLLTVAEWRDDVEEDLEQVETLPRHAGQREDGCDSARKSMQEYMIGKNKEEAHLPL